MNTRIFMNAHTLFTVAIAATAITASAQSAIDALQITQPDFRGTARFMSMGGAFTALGGDLGSMAQNPAGIGIYRHSEIAATLDIDIMKATTKGAPSYSDTRTKAACNNFGYVGTANLGENSALRTFSWGVTYNRMAQFDRHLNGYSPKANTSLTNYIASYSTNAGYTPDMLNFGDNYNPYMNSDADWLSILAYNSYMINDVNNRGFIGMYNNDTNADALLDVRERGYVDEYSFNFGGNVSDVVYWGLGVGVTDLSYTRETSYSESLANATMFSSPENGLIDDGDAGYYLDNWKHITGTGWKMSFGLIFKPTNELRIGAAIHSPTYWSLSQDYQGSTSYSYYDPVYTQGSDNPMKGNEQTDYASFDWRLNSPWRFMVGIAGVIGNKAIVSMDFERVAYNDMKVKNARYDYYGYIDGYSENADVNEDIHNYAQAANIVRVGAEYRVTNRFSVRAGYNMQTSNISDKARHHELQIITAGTDPSYSFDKTTTNITCGLGYKFGAFYLDGAYMYTTRNSTLHAYTSFDGIATPEFDVSQSNSSVVLTAGFKF